LNPFARWYRLPGSDRRALWPATWRLLYVRLLLATRGLKVSQARLARSRVTKTRTLENPDAWQARLRALQRISRRLPATRCLARSLTLWWWMRRQGLAPQLRIGVDRTAGTLEGHAWVECDGHLFDETRTGAERWTRVDVPFRQ
jgi:hypothetical protein